MHELLDDWGIQVVQKHESDVRAAYNAGKTIDTSMLTFGFYASAQIVATAVANGVLKRADRLDQTVVQDNQRVATVSGEFIPAIYAQAYEDSSGRLYLIITNKGAEGEASNITVNGTVPSGRFSMTFVTGGEPSAVNTASAPDHIRARFQTTQTPIMIPGFSVIRLDL